MAEGEAVPTSLCFGQSLWLARRCPAAAASQCSCLRLRCSWLLLVNAAAYGCVACGCCWASCFLVVANSLLPLQVLLLVRCHATAGAVWGRVSVHISKLRVVNLQRCFGEAWFRDKGSPVLPVRARGLLRSLAVGSFSQPFCTRALLRLPRHRCWSGQRGRDISSHGEFC